MNRRLARDTAFSLIFEMEYHKGEDSTEIYNLALLDRELEDDEYVKKVFFGLFNDVSEIDAKISESAVGWKIERISKVSLAIMRLCVYEMLHLEDVPVNVALNEAIELAKKYDHDTAPAFINGILNDVATKEGLTKNETLSGN